MIMASSPADPVATAQSDLASLNRVSHRLALLSTSTELGAVLDKLLPRLLQRIGDNHQTQLLTADATLAALYSKIHARLVEMLSHVMKRVRDDQSTPLPCLGILQLFLLDGNKVKPHVDPFTLNLGLAFLTLGVGRLIAADEAARLLPGLLVWHSHFSTLTPDQLQQASTKSQWHQTTHLLLRTMDAILLWQPQERPGTLVNSTTDSNKRFKATNATESTTAISAEDTDHDPIAQARRLIAQDSKVASTLYDLMLDVLLYQTSPLNSNVPPPGASQAGQERLAKGNSTTARDWAAEMASRQKLVEIKSRMIDWIAPSKSWGLFLSSSDSESIRNKTRTCALLMVAAGDSTPEVSQRASLYWKQYMDTQQQQQEPFGNAQVLLQEVLTLCVGSSNAQMLLSSSQGLGWTYEDSGNTQATLALKRRMISSNDLSTTFCALMEFACQILQDSPNLFQQQDYKGIASLTILATSKRLGELHTAAGLTLARGKPYVASAQLLQALVVRLTTTSTTSNENNESLALVLAKCMGIACSCLSTVLSSRSTTSNNGNNSSVGSEGNIAVRDALYGAICILCRSPQAYWKGEWLFAAGASTNDDNSSNMETAKLLFGCITGEEEVLRPRAVAALDALLSSYSRLVKEQQKQIAENNSKATTTLVVDNPWGQPATSTSTIATTTTTTTTAAQPTDNNLAKQLLPLLWNSAQHFQPKQARVAAARWASDLLLSLDITNACHLLCFLAGDADVTASAIARDTLLATKNKDQDTLDATAATTLADFGQLARVLLTDSTATTRGVGGSGSSSWRPSYWEFTPKGRAVAIEYLLSCLLHDVYGGDDDDDSMKLFVAALATSIVEATRSGAGHVASARQENLTWLDRCAGALSLCLSTSILARSLVASTTQEVDLGPDTLCDLALSCPSSKARRLLAKCWGHLQNDSSLWKDEVWVEKVQSTLRTCEEIMERSVSSVGNKHGAAFLAGTCIQVYRQRTTVYQDPESSMGASASRIMSHMGNEVMSSDDVVANAFADGLAIACSYDQLDAPVMDGALIPGASVALSKLTDAIRKYGNGETIDVARVSKLAKSAGTCLAATTATSGANTGNELGEARLKCVDALFSLLGSVAFRKEEEVALWAGEALAEYADAYSPKDVKWSTEQDDWPDSLDEEFSKGLPPHQQVIYVLLRRAKYESNPQKRTATAPALLAVVARAAKQVNLHSSRADRCLVQELGRRLDDIQRCFISLLSDPKSKHLSRESCCLGLAACRSLANLSSSQNAGDEMNGRLLRAFGQTTIHGGSAMQETAEQAAERRRAEASASADSTNDAPMADAEVGGASGIGEASLGAYREMAAAAMSLGRPDILYALLMLSVSNAAWTSEGRDYGPSAILGQQSSSFGSRSNAAEMRVALKGHLGKLMSRILRGCHSPNKDTREQMQNLWNGLTGGGAEARSLISQHLLVTIDTLIEDTTSKLWRTRYGACAALAQVIVGRSWKELGGGLEVLFDDDVVTKTTTEVTSAGIRLLRLWRVAMRSLDDVRSNVREAGETLGRGVRSLTLRLVNPQTPKEEEESPNSIISHERDASAAAATALRWLIKHGLKQPCAEAAGVCVSCLVGIVDVANPAILQPLVPDLLRSLLLSMSSLEPAAFNYLQVRAAGQDRGSGESYDALERLRLQVVQSGPMAMAVTKCLDMMPDMDIKIQKAVVPELDSAIRLSAGLTTRTAAADCVSTLCSTCPDAFRNSGPSSTNPSVSLLRALYWASERERGQAARDKYAHACGNLAALCPGSSVRSLALRASHKYNSSTGNNDDPAARKAAAITLRAIAVKASNQFLDGGNSDIWCRRVLPVAFLGMRDTDPKVASLFSDVWEEGGSTANHSGAADGFGTLLEEKLIISLVAECVKAVRDVSWARRVTGADALKELARKEILSPAPRRLNGNAKDFILEESVRAQRRAEASNTALAALVNAIADTRLWSGKEKVVEACALIASKWSSALANVEDSRETLGLGDMDNFSSARLQAPLILTDTDQIDCLFLDDRRFNQETERDLADESEQANDMSLDQNEEPVAQAQLGFDDDHGSLDEEAETSGLESAAEDVVMPEARKLVPTYVGICRMFLVQAFPTARSTMSVKEEEVLPYRSSALNALRLVLESLDATVHELEQKKIVFAFLASRLLPLFTDNESDDSEQKEESPLIVSKAIDCFAASFWKDFDGSSEGSPNNTRVKVPELIKIFEQCSIVERPWTIKSSALMACARLVSKANSNFLRDYGTIASAVECASLAMKDRKFWKVRHAGLEALHALVSRCGNSSQKDHPTQERQLLLEAVLPQKEIVSTLAKRSLTDPEAKVTELASRILSLMAWWP